MWIGKSAILKLPCSQNTVADWHKGWNPAVFRECLVGKTQAVVVVVELARPAGCDWCLRPTVTVNTLCWLKASQRCQHRTQQQHNIGSQPRKGGAAGQKLPKNNKTRQQQQHNMILQRRQERNGKSFEYKNWMKTKQQHNCIKWSNGFNSIVNFIKYSFSDSQSIINILFSP